MIFKRPATGESKQPEPQGQARTEQADTATRQDRPEGGEPTRGISEDNTELV